MNEWVSFIHILATFVWVGGVIVLNAVITGASRRSDRSAVVRLNAEVDWVGLGLIFPSTLVVIGVGSGVAWAASCGWPASTC